MRILLISLLLFATSAAAQPAPAIDCDAIKNSTVPVELAYHGQDGTRTVVQAHRDTSGGRVVWTHQTQPSTRPNPPVFVTKAIYVDGTIASADWTTPYAGKYSHHTLKYTPDGLPRHFDRRSDLTYKMRAVSTDGENITQEKTSTISYKFKSEGTVAVGSCVLQVIHGESENTNEAGRTRRSFQLYFPELQIMATATDAEPIVDGLSTVLSEIKPVNARRAD
ncbi:MULTISPECIES: hypothetical protein [unclassified Bradyrhizobium]|uniref:hypothetical protein n=1 Tax=unclassified Bradyrhizobium TaxID=2631580 RepID=UPI001BAD57BA|nr:MULTISPECIES: hypothetical protein [unclassified Bradyrhizobium]MBR1228614.1 hypothetical protein [Bradyrhizobium sp. AUGA SZCCT0176]MBR1284618.1 hypothetical protein [Bradyrhizobium sp. AUGA SZCCT0177]MBR1297523.1 hypothetical protein [Bradyrhizobium sp. AUGA SZCCT0042]